MFDDEAIKRATASVFDRDGFCGTAWLGAPGFAITAAHVVADLAARKPKAMTFKLLFFDTPVSGSLNATNIDYFHDVAVLSIAQEGLLADVHPIPIAASTEVRAGQDWTAYGPADGHPRGLWLREQIISLAGWTEDGAPAIQLVTRQAAAEHLRGMSGAPVLVNGAAIAILREFPVRMPGEHVLLASRLDAAARSLPTLAGLIDAGNRSRKQQSASTFDGYCRRVIRKWDEIAYQGMFAFDTPRSSFPPLETIYVRQPFRREMTPSRAPRGTVVCDSENTSIESSLQHHRNILVQGDAGSGKTSMLRHVCIQLASDWVVQMQHRFLPVYVSAQSLVVANRGGSLEDRIRDAVAIDIGMSMERDFFRQALPEGASWLLIIDGLDEIVRSDQRRLLIDQIMLEANDQAEAKHLLVSSRPIVDLHTSLGEEQFSRFTLVPFDRTQALNLVDRWFAFFDRAPSTSAGFLRMIDESALKGILETPVLLTMALLSYLGGQVNGYCTRVELYDRFIEGTLDAARMRTGLNNVSSAWAELFGSEGERAALTLQRGRRELLRELAMHQQFQGNDRTIGMRKLFDICVARGWFAASLCDGFEKRRIINSLLPEALLQSGLVRLTPDSLQFTHNTIREFLCAELLVRQHPIESEVAQNVLNQWGDARWREVVLSSLSIWSSEKKARSSVMFFFDRLMSLSRLGTDFVACAIAEGVQVEPEQRSELVARLIETFSRWNPCVQSLMTFRTPDPVPVLRQLVKEKECRKQFLELLAEGASNCPRSLGRLLNLAFEFMSADELEAFATHARHVWMRADSFRLLALKGDPSSSVSLLSAVVRDRGCPLNARRKALVALCDLNDGAEAIRVLRASKIDPLLRVTAYIIQFERSAERHYLARATDLWKTAVDGRTEAREIADLGAHLCANLLTRNDIADRAREVCGASNHVAEIFGALVKRTQVISLARRFLCGIADDALSPIEIRFAAASALASVGYVEDVRGTLSDLARDTSLSSEKRVEVAEYMARAGERGPLTDLMSDASVDDWHKARAAISLAMTGDAAKAHERLSESVRNVDMPHAQRVEIAAALVQLGDHELGLDVLRKFSADQKRCKRVIRILFDLGRPEEIERILVDLQNGDDLEFGVEALTELGAFASLQRLLPRMPVQFVKDRIEEVLYKSSTEKANQASLERLFADP